jgi:site-specific recombinase XerC
MTPGVPDTTPGPPPPGATGPHAGTVPLQRTAAPETARLYAIDWQTFAAWCQTAGLTALPAAPATVAAFLAAAGETISAGALGRRAAAIGDRHRQRGLTSPTADPAVRAILRQTRRAATPRRKPPQRPTQLQRMAAACPGDLAGMRDRALLLLAAAGLGRAALVGLDAEHLRFTATAVELTLPQPGPDGDRLRCLVVPCGATLATCPVQALRTWLDTSGTRFGPVFRKIDRWGSVEHPRLGTDAIRRILARRTPRRVRHSRTGTAAA